MIREISWGTTNIPAVVNESDEKTLLCFLSLSKGGSD